MSVLRHRMSAKLMGALVGLMLLAALLPALSSTPAREVSLVAKGMAFYLEDDLQTPNPTIEVKAGERVRIVLRNEDRGMTHDVAVPPLDVVLEPVSWNESGEVAFDVPSEPGTYEYFCRPHHLMMQGTIRVSD
jgi:plastocyanin